MYLPLFAGVLCWSLFWYALLYVFSSFINHLDEEERAGFFAFIVFRCLVTVNVLLLFPHKSIHTLIKVTFISLPLVSIGNIIAATAAIRDITP